MIGESNLNVNDDELIKTLSFENGKFNFERNLSIVKVSTIYFKNYERFVQ